MIEQGKVAEESLAKFIQNIVAGETIYSLRGEEGFATVQSLHFEHEDGEPAVVMCFWGTEQEAKNCLVDDWVGFSVAEIELVDFLENWCVGMENDRILGGLNFDNTMDNGYEATTLELILDVIEEIRAQEKEITLVLHKDIDDLESQVADVLESGNE